MIAGDRAMWLHTCALLYANEYLTNGFISREVLRAISPITRSPEKLVPRLIGADLWHKVDGGWQIHGYLDAQRSSDEIRESREKDAKRKADVRKMSVRTPAGQVTESERNPEGVRDVEKSREEERREEKTTALSTASTVRTVFDAWIASTGRTPQTVLDSKRERLIRNALKAFPVQDVLDAVDGWSFSPHHRGENDRHTIYNDLNVLLRDAAQVEKFRDLKRGVGNVVPIIRKTTAISSMFQSLDAADQADAMVAHPFEIGDAV
jgi:hypothetical protein